MDYLKGHVPTEQRGFLYLHPTENGARMEYNTIAPLFIPLNDNIAGKRGEQAPIIAARGSYNLRSSLVPCLFAGDCSNLRSHFSASPI